MTQKLAHVVEVKFRGSRGELDTNPFWSAMRATQPNVVDISPFAKNTWMIVFASRRSKKATQFFNECRNRRKGFQIKSVTTQRQHYIPNDDFCRY